MTSTPESRAAALERRSLAQATPGRRRLRLALLPALVFIVGAGATVLAFVLVDDDNARSHETVFERRAEEAAMRLRAELELPLVVLDAIPGLFAASQSVERDEFRTFVAPFLEQHRSLSALEWLPWVPLAARAQLEQAAQADGLAGFTFTEIGPDGRLVPAGSRDAYIPIYYMEPPDRDALGFDVLSEPGRRATATTALTGGAMVVSPRFQLIEDRAGVYALAVYAPAYSEFPVPPDEAGRRRTFRGFGIGIVRLAPLLGQLLETLEPSGFELVLLDESADDERSLLYESQAGLSRRETGGAWVWESSFPFANRRYRVRFVATAELMRARERPWVLLGGGLTVSLLAGLGLLALASARSLRREMSRALELGRYTLVEKLGQGGMGVVYRAKHAMLRRPTALKLLRSGNDTRLMRFEREVQLTSQLTHPNTIQIYDYGRTPDGIFYYAMEFLEGITLEELLRFDGPQDPARVVYLLVQVCGSLAEAHTAGLIHRDVKPANIMLTQRGGLSDFVKVLDFGLVKDTAAPEDLTLSVDAGFLGTPMYLSPEAIEAPETLDGRADLYAVGAVGYALLTGTPVFSGTSKMAVLTKHLSAEPELPSDRLGRDMPEALEAVVMQCLAKAPDDRPASATALRRTLTELRDVGRWRQADAERWWTERAPTVLERVRAARREAVERGTRPSHATVDVALEDRGSRRG